MDVVGRGIGSVGDVLQRSASLGGLLAAQRVCMEKMNILIHFMPRRY